MPFFFLSFSLVFSKVLSSSWVQHPQETFGLHNVVIALFEEERLFEEEEEEEEKRHNSFEFYYTHIYIYIYREKKRDEHCVVFLKSNGSRPTPRRRLLSTKKITIIQKSIVVVVVDVDGTKKRRPKKSECGLRSRPRRPKRGEMAVNECVLAKLKR